MKALAVLNSQQWVRPSLMALTGVCYLLTLAPGFTWAHRAGAALLPLCLTLGAGSVGQSNSGLKPKE